MATSQEIRSYAKGLGYNPNDKGEYQVNNDADAMSIYGQAAAKGYTSGELDDAFGWKPGAAAGWVSSKGYKPLGIPADTRPQPPVQVDEKPAVQAPPAARVEPRTASMIPKVVEQSYAQTPVAAQPAATPQTELLNKWFDTYMTSQPKPVTSAVQAPAAVRWEVDPTKTTQGIIQDLTRENSPVLQQARERGLQTANSRGMLNSSQAIRDSDSALYEKAAMIAATDAGIYAKAGEANANAANQVNVFNTGQSNSFNTANLDRMMSGAQFGLKQAQDESQFGRGLAEKGRDSNLGAQTQLTIAGLNFDISDRRLSQDDKQFMKSFSLEEKKLGAQVSQFAQRFGLDVKSLENDLTKTANQNSQFYMGLSQDDKQFYDKLKLGRDQLDQTAKQFTSEWENRFTLQGLDQAGKINLAKLDSSNRIELANVEARFKKDIANSQLIGGAWQTWVTEIGKIQNNPDLEPAAKTAHIQNSINQFDNFAKFFKGIAGDVDISALLNFKITPVAGAPAVTPGVPEQVVDRP